MFSYLRSLGRALCCLCCVLGASVSAQASPFQTPEYYGTNSSAYDAINLAKAYELGFTGQGVVLGIVDTGLMVNHREFLNKVTGTYFAPDYVFNWAANAHGTHVGGTMVGAKDDRGMHGVAFGANIMAAGFSEANNYDTLRYMLQQPAVRIINHSWNLDYYLEDYPNWDYMQKEEPVYSQLFIELGLADKLSPVAAGNEGHLGPGALIQTSLKNPAITGTMINVIAVNSSKARNAVDLPAEFTNLAFGGAQDVSISAPGVDIRSADARTTAGYFTGSGTSMATPMVSGVLGLMAQAFPYMTAKQLSSTLFSTASKFAPADYVVVIQRDRVTGPDGKDRIKYSNNLIYFGPKTGRNEVADLTAYYNANVDEVGLSLAAFLGLDRKVTENATFADVYGHGYMDAGRAVQGPGYFKASWLDPRNDVHQLAADGGAGVRELQYTVDTKGYSSIWSNDISQIQYGGAYPALPGSTVPVGLPTEFNKEQLAYYGYADAAAALADLGTLNIGLTKRGKGILFLTGDNTYKGHTVIAGGGISLSLGSKEGSIERAWVQTEGTLLGSGTVRENVVNDGLVSPGFGVGKISVKDYTQHASGNLFLQFDQQGKSDQLVVGNNAKLDGTLSLAPLIGYWGNASTVTLATPLLSIAGTTSGVFSNTDTHFSPTLKLNPQLNADYTGTMTVTRPADAYSQYASNGSNGSLGRALFRMGDAATGDMRNLYTALDFSSLDGSSVRRALKTLAPSVYQGASEASLSHNRVNNAHLLGLFQGHSQGKAGAGGDAVAATGLAGGSSAGAGKAYAVLMPQGGGSYQPGQSGEFDSATSYAGVLGAWNTHFEAGQAGLSLGYGRRQTKNNGDVGEALTDVLSLGGQFFVPELYATQASALWLFGAARVGLENTQTTRKVQVDDYYRQSKSDFSAFTASLDTKLGWEWLSEYVGLGPFAGLSYGGYFRPAITEGGGAGNATALKLESGDTHSLRSSLGLQARVFNAVQEDVQVQAVLSAAWDHEFLDAGTVRASFAGYENTFTTDHTRGRDFLVTQASVNFAHAPSGMSVSLFGGVETGTQQYSGFNVGFSVGVSW